MNGVGPPPVLANGLDKIDISLAGAEAPTASRVTRSLAGTIPRMGTPITACSRHGSNETANPAGILMGF
jgi:hypothetical protein